MTKDADTAQLSLGRRAWNFFKGPMLLGLVIGLVVGVFVGLYDIDIRGGLSLFAPQFIDLSVFLAAAVALLYIVIGVITGFAAAMPDKINLGPHTDSEDVIEQRSIYIWQGISSIALGLAIGFLLLANPFVVISSGAAFTGFLIFSVIGIFGFLRCWKDLDELHKAVSAEATTIGYYLVLVVGGTWSVLGHLELAKGPDFIDWIVILWSMILIASFIAMFRRGMLEE